ncbi:MAG: aminopeptidase P family protein [Ruminococcaceae bacterium]|nr:aminopeptidase P family protein [Oscillospiraceae bacterium]
MNNIRLTDLISNLPQKIDSCLIFDNANKRYLTGLNTDDAGTLIIGRNSSFFIIDSRYIEVAKRCISSDIEVVLQQNLFEQINEIFSMQNTRSYCIETQTTSVFLCEKLKKTIKSSSLDLSVDAGEIVSKLRAIKSFDELENIKTAQKITEKAFDYILGKIKEEISEKELALELEFYMRSNGATATAFEIIFIGGKNTSMPHGVPGKYRLKKGDLITIDFGADYNGYKSDMTRTLALGSVNDEQKTVYKTVLAAQNAALEIIKEGVLCSDVDKRARDVIKTAGYGDFFGHALGHSVGLEIHEAPNFSPKCNEILKEGMVLTVEPGIYLPEKFGVRIEDMVYVTKNGAENLTKSDKTLIIL